MEQDIHQYYNSNYPGQVVVLGADLFNCTPSSLGTFAQSTGATFPLLLNAAIATGGNIQTLYGERDHYVVISKQGIVRYQANDRWPYGNGYHLDEIRGCVDSLVTAVVGVEPGARPRGFALSAAPNPYRAGGAIELSNPAGRDLPARVRVMDLAGHELAALWDAPLPPGVTRVRWDGLGRAGARLAPGLYLVRAEIGAVRLARRVVVLR